jgi:prevent-host-death family protein
VRIVSLAEVKAKLSAFLDEAGQSGPVVITRNGRAVAVLLAPSDDDDLERLLLSRSPRFRALLSKARSSIQAGQGIGHAEFWKGASDRAAQHPVERGGRRGVRPNRKRSKSVPPAR